MKLGILGPVGYQLGAYWWRPSGGRQQKLLAILLLAGGRLTTVDRLCDLLWDADPPRTAARQVINTASLLRRELSEVGGPRVMCVPGAYQLPLAGHDLDEETFRALTARGRESADLAAGATQLRQALGLWRGPALAGLDTGYLRAAADQLDQLRVATQEDLAWLELRRGNPHEALRLLADPCGHRERTTLVRMLALVCAGRRTDALAEFRQLRTTLVRTLGIEPQPEIAELHREMLRGTRSADLMAAAAPFGLATRSGAR
jgi:DNA-binding SARP family transcriptional activator